MSASSDDSDFGGRFARQFFNSDCPNVTSTPDNSFCESGYESFNPLYKLITDINNNNITSSNITDNLSNISNNHSHNCSTGNNSDVCSSNVNDSNNNSIISAATASITSSSHNNINSNKININTSTVTNNNNNNIANQSTISLRTQQSDLSVNVIQRQQRSNSLFTTAPAVANILNAKNPWSTQGQGLQDVYQRFNNADKIERAASLHRNAASYSEPKYTWSGQLPSRSHKNPLYSCKVFLGGVPWDIDEQGLMDTFGRFGPLRVQWPPSKEIPQQQGQEKKAGYVYIIYDSERCVKSLLQACTQDFGAGSHPERYFYQLSSRRMRFKEVQVIPWIQADSNYIRNQSGGRPDMHRTVFVGALHGMMTAEGLARVMNDLFGGVAYVGIDTDKHKYPLGSGRCAFNNQKSYMKAISAGFVEVKSPQFCKKIQLDPYLVSSNCSTCHVQNGHLFCRDCLRYFCKTCWNWRHSTESIIGRLHRPMMRNKRDT